MEEGVQNEEGGAQGIFFFFKLMGNDFDGLQGITGTVAVDGFLYALNEYVRLLAAQVIHNDSGYIQKFNTVGYGNAKVLAGCFEDIQGDRLPFISLLEQRIKRDSCIQVSGLDIFIFNGGLGGKGF